MEDIKAIVTFVYDFLRTKIDVYGYQLSLWDMLVYSVVLSFVFVILRAIFSHGGD